MPVRLLIAVGPGEWRAALVEDGNPVELHVERGNRRERGSLYLGRVLRLMPGLGAAFVDIGGEHPALLPYGEIWPRDKPLEEGGRVLVQVRREGLGGKAERVTMRVLLPGCAVELRIGRPGVLGGDKLAPAERAGLVAALAEGDGVAIGEPPPPQDELLEEIAGRYRRWREIMARARRAAAPIRLDPPSGFAGAVATALCATPTEIFVDDHAAIPWLRAAFPESTVHYRPADELPLDVGALIDQALAPTLSLPSGGKIHIDRTRAAVLIDVDSGPRERGPPEAAALAADLEAAAAIARELRLRNLGGGIVVDFVGLDRAELRERLRAAFARALERDPSGPRVLGWTRLGHLELVRPRRGPALAEILLDEAVSQKTAVTVAYEAMRAFARAARAEPQRDWRLLAAPEVVAALEGETAQALREVEEKLGRKIAVIVETGRERERFQLVPA